jgi:hypothetical protein
MPSKYDENTKARACAHIFTLPYSDSGGVYRRYRVRRCRRGSR